MSNNPHARFDTCDIFCSVIDNYGDIGVCWRLARQLAHEHGLAVRLWVDDLASFAKLCPEADVTLETQHRRGVEVCRWNKESLCPSPSDEKTSHSTKPASGQVAGYPARGRGWPIGQERVAYIVIEAFACKLPESYIAAMAAQEQQPIWINLEYLSAEDWVAGCHGLPSPHPRLPLTKYFFFPGFTRQTGGLLLERDLFARRDAFQADVAAQQQFWQSLGLHMPAADTLKVSLFAYENVALPGLFDAWASGTQAILCLVPEGRILPQVEQYFTNMHSPRPYGGEGERVNYTRGNLHVRVLPFVAQEDYDLLLWACDVNFVRGEDSCVRAQWAGKPFVWQIYPQHDDVHTQKLQAFLDLYNAPLSDTTRHAVQGLWKIWNGGVSDGDVWNDFAAALGELTPHARDWARLLAENNLALNLLDFCQKVGRMRALKIEGQRT